MLADLPITWQSFAFGPHRRQNFRAVFDIPHMPMCACAYIYIYTYVYIYINIYIYTYISACIWRNRESLSVHPLLSLPAPHGTKSSCGRLDKSIWHGSLHRCSLNCAERRTDAGRNLHLEYRHLGACLMWEQRGFTWAGNAGPEPPNSTPVSKGLCPGPTAAWQLLFGGEGKQSPGCKGYVSHQKAITYPPALERVC